MELTITKKIKSKIVNFWSENKYYFSVFCVLLFLTFGFILAKGKDINFNPEVISKKMFIIFSCAGCLILGTIYFILLKNIDKKEIKLEKLFLSIIIPIEILYMFALPLKRVPDERAHAYRAYEVSLGILVSDESGARYLPGDITEVSYLPEDNYVTWFSRAIKASIDSDKDMVKCSFPNLALYSFICYIPQALGIAVARIFTSKLLVMFYFGKAFNFIAFVLLFYFAIKFMPFKKLFIFIIGLLPMTMQESVSLSADCLTTAISVFFVSYMFYLIYSHEGKLTKLNYVILFISGIVLSLCKIIYIPIVFLIYMLPKDKFKSKKQKYVICTLIVALLVIINLLWLSYASRYLFEVNEGVNSSEQAKFILTKSFSYIIIIFRTLDTYFDGYVQNILGNALGIMDVQLTPLYRHLLLGIILFFVFCDNTENKIDKKMKFCITFILLLVFALLMSSLYVQWTPLKKDIIEGVQGRYLIPILILLPLLGDNNFIKLNNKISKRLLLITLVFINFSAIISLFSVLL